jgi:hypothetical protein
MSHWAVVVDEVGTTFSLEACKRTAIGFNLSYSERVIMDLNWGFSFLFKEDHHVRSISGLEIKREQVGGVFEEPSRLCVYSH